MKEINEMQGAVCMQALLAASGFICISSFFKIDTLMSNIDCESRYSDLAITCSTAVAYFKTTEPGYE